MHLLNAHKKNESVLLLCIVMMSVIGLISSDIFLPALPDIIAYYGVNARQGQTILGYFLFGIAGMQLFYGPLSDSLGRRRLLIAGVLVFSVTSAAIPFAQNFQQIIALRILQAIGACAGITLGRAIVSDLFPKDAASNIFLKIFPIVGMSPAIAPLIGGILQTIWGWKACFVFSMAFGLLLLFLLIFTLPETLPETNRRRLSIHHVASSYRSLLTSVQFWHYAIIPCIAYSVYFAYIAQSPFLLQEQGIPANAVGYSYISLSAMYITGNIVARRLLAHSKTLDQILALGYRIFLLGGIVLILVTALFSHQFSATIAAMSIITLGNGFLLPLGTSGAVTCMPRLAGSASGLMGALQIGSAAWTANHIGQLTANVPQRFGIIICVFILFGYISFIVLGRLSKDKRLAQA